MIVAAVVDIALVLALELAHTHWCACVHVFQRARVALKRCAGARFSFLLAKKSERVLQGTPKC